MKGKSLDLSKFSQDDLKKLAVQVLSKIKNAEQGIGKELFDVIISLTPQVAIEAVVVDSIEKPTKVLVTPRDDRNYPKKCHLPGSFIRYSESFSERLSCLIRSELKVGIKRFKDTNIKYNRLERKNKRHFVGVYFLVELKEKPKVKHQWINYIPINLPEHHKVFLKNYFGWKTGKALWN